MGKRIEIAVGENVPNTTLSYVGEAPPVSGRRHVFARCNCGEIFSARLSHIMQGRTAGCKACKLKMFYNDITGQKFGRWQVISIAGSRPSRGLTFNCICECGTKRVVSGTSLLDGSSVSCGCYQREVAAVNWPPGTIIGCFEILEQCSMPRGTGYRVYRVYDRRDGRHKRMRQGTITSRATTVGYVKAICRSRLNCALRRRRIEKTVCFSEHLEYTLAEFVNVVGHKPGIDYHLDHICPLACAEDEMEAVMLFSLQNLRWVPGKVNMQKGASWTPEGAALHLELLGRPWENPDA